MSTPAPARATAAPAPATGRAAALLVSALGVDAAVVVRSPGRVNLIGDHTDYNDGLALPLAIDRELVLAMAPRDDDRVRLVSERDGVVHDFALADLVSGVVEAVARWPSWTTYVQGVLRQRWVEPDDGARPRGLDAAVASDLPEGAGLSSSAALELAVGRAAAVVDGTHWDPSAAARDGRRAENEWVGVATGIMDQLAVAHGRAAHAMALDCRDATWTHVPVPDDLDVLVLDTGARRSLVGSAYDDRRHDCEDAVARLGVASLRDVDDLAALADLPAALRARARHVVTENERVRVVAAALRAGDLAELATAMRASHASLRDDYEVTGPELDTMAALANETPGIVGARMTGGGFGGAVVALAHPGEVDVEEMVARYREVHDLPAEVLVVRPADGTSLVDVVGSG